MEEAIAADVVQMLRDRRIFAHVNRRAGVYNVGVRVVIPDGREAIWDNDGAAGLEAMVLRDGVLVGYVPQIPDSDDLDAATIARIIADADYDVTAATTPQPPAAAKTSAPPPPPARRPQAEPAPRPPGPRSWRERFRRRG